MYYNIYVTETRKPYKFRLYGYQTKLLIFIINIHVIYIYNYYSIHTQAHTHTHIHTHIHTHTHMYINLYIFDEYQQ